MYTLNWSMQVQEVCKKPRRQIGFLYKRIYQYVSCSTFLRLYLTYICPHLKCAVAVWDPHQQGLINALESVQKFVLRASTKNWKADYETLIKSCNIPTLAEQRNLLKLCILYQLMNGHVLLPAAPIERRLQRRNLRNSASLLLQRPVVHAHKSTSNIIFSM